MAQLALPGFVALLFGAVALRLQGAGSAFALVNLAVGAIALGLAAANAARSAGRRAAHTANPALSESVLHTLAVAWGGALLVFAAALTGWRADLTFEGRYALADATQQALESLPGLRMTLYYDEDDPRIRRSRLLLDEMAAAGRDTTVRQRSIDAYPEDEDRFGIAASNSVVLEYAGRWEIVDQTREGPLFEALSKLATERAQRLYLAVGTGEGDFDAYGRTGYSGLGAALETEGYQVVPLPTAFIDEIPRDADALLVVAPERAWRAESVEALARYLERGGRLVAMLEPGETSGLEALLAAWGLASPDAVVIDTAFAEVDGEAPGTAPVVFNYATHPVTQGLDRNRVSFFRGARAFVPRKPQVDDKLASVVFTSSNGWRSEDLGLLSRAVNTGLPQPPRGTRLDYQPLAVAGTYDRSATEDGSTTQTRIVAFGDADFANNRYLRALYNLDLVLNAVHWVVERESAITLRPKAAQVVQFPLPVQSTLGSFYGVGLLIPELLLIAAGVAWLRRRNA